MRRSLRNLLVVAAAGATVAAVAAPPAYAGSRQDHSKLHVVATLSSSFEGPLQFAVAGKYVFVADSFTSTLNLIGRSTPLATGPSPAKGGDIAGVAVDRAAHALAYTSSNGSHSVTRLTILRLGHKPVIANLAAFEKNVNPDRVVHYGVAHASACVRNALTAAGVPVSYTGAVDSHPYAVTAIGHGAWAVADAGGNDVVKVDRYGRVSLLSVLPRQPLKITKQMAAENMLPKCVIGITYNFEAVPTDVEIGAGGWLYVTTLPGGLPAPGSLYKIGPWGGTAHRIATGFNEATNLAIGAHGAIFVAELGSGTIAKVWHGRVTRVLSLPNVVALEYANGHLYASTAPAANGINAPGTVVLLGN